MGGVFTERIGWRWCFLINLPLGVITFAGIFFFLHPPSLSDTECSSTRRIFALDLLGAILHLTSAVQLLLAVEWGGTKLE